MENIEESPSRVCSQIDVNNTKPYLYFTYVALKWSSSPVPRARNPFDNSKHERELFSEDVNKHPFQSDGTICSHPIPYYFTKHCTFYQYSKRLTNRLISVCTGGQLFDEVFKKDKGKFLEQSCSNRIKWT